MLHRQPLIYDLKGGGRAEAEARGRAVIPPPLAACVAVVESPASRKTARGFARSSRGAAFTMNEKLRSDRIPKTRIFNFLFFLSLVDSGYTAGAVGGGG